MLQSLLLAVLSSLLMSMHTLSTAIKRSYYRKFHSRRRKKRPKIFHGKRYQETETEKSDITSGCTVSKSKLTLPQPSIEAEVSSDSEASSSSLSDETDMDSDSDLQDETSDGSDGDEMDVQAGCESSGNRVFDIAELNSAVTKAANCSEW